MDMTGWWAIRRDVLVKEHGVSTRQALELGHLLEHGLIRIKDFEALRPKVDRRSLQRDLKAMLAKGLLTAEGATDRRGCKLKKVNGLDG